MWNTSEDHYLRRTLTLNATFLKCAVQNLTLRTHVICLKSGNLHSGPQPTRDKIPASDVQNVVTSPLFLSLSLVTKLNN